VKAIAPGKLVLTGAYAVLRGAPAIVIAVDRYAVADASCRALSVTMEVAAALGDEPAPHVDTAALHDGDGRKLGLGSSAAALVASLAARALARGLDPAVPLGRARLFRAARVAHARAQRGGSGVDVAASVHGGALRYAIDRDAAVVRALELPARLVVAAYFSGSSARTSDLRARVDAHAARYPKQHAALAAGMAEAADLAAGLFEAGEAARFVAAAGAYGGLLAGLGRAADAPIVPPAFAELGALAEREGAAFFPSGAGGGDVGVWLSTAPPSPAFDAFARALACRPLPFSIDRGGVRREL
jgi:phosphomevalonate kinase